MTLSEISGYVCAKIGQTDDDSVAACKLFINRRNQLIWESALWAESQALVTVTADTPSVVIFPASVARVLRLRNTGTLTDVLGVGVGSLFDFDSTIFEATGQEYKFVHLPTQAVGVTMQPGQLSILSSADETLTFVGGDSIGGLIRETMQYTGFGVEEVTTLNFTGINGASFNTSGGTGVGKGFVISGINGPCGIWFNYQSLLAQPDFSSSGVVDQAHIQAVGVDGTYSDSDVAEAVAALLNSAAFGNNADTQYWGGSSSAAVVTADDLYVGARVDAQTLDSGAVVTVAQQGTDASRQQTVNSYAQLYGVSRPIAYANPVYIYDATNNLIGTLAAGETIFPTGATTGVPPPRQRIQVYPTPSTAQTYLAHVKVTCQDLTLDTDRPTLLGAVNALLDFAQGDMLERQRQYGKAKEKMADAQVKMQVMLDNEKNQQAWDSRVIPANIHSNDCVEDGLQKDWL